jgi:hypothetical protein
MVGFFGMFSSVGNDHEWLYHLAEVSSTVQPGQPIVFRNRIADILIYFEHLYCDNQLGAVVFRLGILMH